MMTKQREEFEAWFNKEVFSLKLADIKLVNCYWDAWRAAIASIVIELPDPDDWGDEQALQEFRERTIASLTSIGIRVKGE